MSKEKPIISFCIPTFNRENYLKKCIESIIGYQGDDIEIIIQDNNSPDNTESVARSYSDSRIHFYRNSSNIGALLNIRTIVDKAEGEYCFFLTDDDFLLPGAIDRLRDYIEIHKPSVLKCDTIVYLEKSNSSYVYSALRETKAPSDITQDEKIGIFMVSHVLTGLCFKKSELDTAFYDRHIDLWYPSTLIVGLLNYNLGYLASPVAIHIWENEIFWGIDNKDKELAISESKGILVLKDKLDKIFFKKLLHHYLISSNITEKELLLEFSTLERILIVKTIFLKKIKQIIKRFFFIIRTSI